MDARGARRAPRAVGLTREETPRRGAPHPPPARPRARDHDDGAHLFESAAIILALADRDAQGRLSFPLGTRERELVYQWAFFAMLEIEAADVTARDEKERDPERHAAARERVREAASVVERALEGRDFIVGDRFSAADIVLGSVLDLRPRPGDARRRLPRGLALRRRARCAVRRA